MSVFNDRFAAQPLTQKTFIAACASILRTRTEQGAPRLRKPIVELHHPACSKARDATTMCDCSPVSRALAKESRR